VNPDTIAARLQPDHKGGPAIMLQAGRAAASERRRLMENGVDFAIETTPTGHSELRMMADARALGYKITLVYIGVNNALTSLARVRGRVVQGGHDVPTETIIRRYRKSLENLPVAIDLADRCFVLDNTKTRHRLVAIIDDRRVRHVGRDPPKWATTSISCLLAAKDAEIPS
jgi:predicted ABC-type ATPase